MDINLQEMLALNEFVEADAWANYYLCAPEEFTRQYRREGPFAPRHYWGCVDSYQDHYEFPLHPKTVLFGGGDCTFVHLLTGQSPVT